MSKSSRTAGNRKPKILPVVLFALCAGVVVAAVVALVANKSEPRGQIAPAPLSSSNRSQSTSAPGSKNGLEDTPLPEDPVQLVNLGNQMLQRGDLTQAMRIYLEALKKNPEDEEVHFNLGFVYARQRMTNEAIHQYEESLRIFPEYAEAHNNLGNLLVGQKKYDEAIDHFSEALKASPEDSSAMNNLGRALMAQGKTNEAIQHFEQAVQANTNYVEAHFNLGNAYLASGKEELAEAQYREVLRISPQAGPAVQAARTRIKGTRPPSTP